VRNAPLQEHCKPRFGGLRLIHEAVRPVVSEEPRKPLKNGCSPAPIGKGHPHHSEERHSLGRAISFGPFRLIGAERRLERDGTHVRLGSRALELLIVLVERAEDVVSKRDLVAKVWPGLTVDESCLRFHVRSLRKALGDNGADARYIATIAGRGYSFIGSIVSEELGEPNPVPKPALAAPVAHLPPRLLRMVGREDAVDMVSCQVRERRFVSLVGPGGIGKTTVAVAVAHELASDFGEAVHFVDFGPLRDLRLANATVASAFGLFLDPEGTAGSLLSYLRGRRALVILDCCEHVIEAIAPLAELIFQEAPQIHILATSRESLRVEGEHVHRLLPLACPPEQACLKAADALTFPAVQLFVDRMQANDLARDFEDSDAPIVAEICRRLDGIALALELAAGRVGAYGIKGIADLLDTQFKLLWHGRRTAIPRHQTLSATLDWSYNLLPEVERVILRRLSVFVGPFPLDAAEFVAAGGQVTEKDIRAGIENLVAKSLTFAETRNGTARYRLLDTTRVYLLHVLLECGEAHDVARRHALHCAGTLRQTHIASLASARTTDAVGCQLARDRAPRPASKKGSDSVSVQFG
jgi:predicted ATPase/DNA-binding winged helix-turn-helix (wHTH) protein